MATVASLLSSKQNIPFQDLFSESGYKNKKPSLYVDSVPKCGTGLLKKMLDLLNIDKGYKSEHHHRHLYEFFPAYASGKELNNFYSANRKYLILYRDPRDAVISQIFFEMRQDIAQNQGNTEKFKKYTFSELVDISLNSEHLQEGQFGSYAQQLFNSFELSLELKKNPAITRLLVRFEDLVPTFAGGAAPKRRYAVIKGICEFAGKKISPGKIRHVMRECWGGTNTFRHDDVKKVGQWKRYFQPHQIKFFQEKYNHILLGLGYETDPDWHLKYV